MRSRIRLSALATDRISSGPRSGSGAAAPFRLKSSAAFANDDSGAVSARAAHRPSKADADDGKQQGQHPRSLPERTLPRPQQLGGNHRTVRQRDTDLVGIFALRQRKDTVAVAEAATQPAQFGVVRIARGGKIRRQPFDLQLRKCPQNVGEEPRPLRRGRGAEKLGHGDKLAVSAVDRRIGLIRPVNQRRSW